MAENPLNTVREILQAYAERGIFRGFNEAGKGRFRFVWVLQHQMELSVDSSRGVLRFRQLLPQIPANSDLYGEIKQFVRSRHDWEVPEHRRIDRRRAEASCFNRGGMVSITLKVKKKNYQYGANRIVNLVHELFQYLRESYPDYLMENFDVPME